jgi:hypothetical protein
MAFGLFELIMTLTQRELLRQLGSRGVAFLAIVFLFLLVCFAWAADPLAKMPRPRPELRLTTLSDNAKVPRLCQRLRRSEESERTIDSSGCSRRIWIFDFDPTFRPA